MDGSHAPVSRDWFAGVVLAPEPGHNGLQGAICTAPACVIEFVLHVVVVVVQAIHQIHPPTKA